MSEGYIVITVIIAIIAVCLIPFVSIVSLLFTYLKNESGLDNKIQKEKYKSLNRHKYGSF